MALALTVRARLWRPTGSAVLRASRDPATLWSVFLTLVVAGPWLASGYIFGTDWPGPRRFDLPTALSSSAPVEVALAAISSVVTAELTAKVLIFGFLLAGSYAAYQAVPAGGLVARGAASLVFVVNPFVYGRMHYGQLFLIAGYMAMPWVLICLWRLLREPGFRNGVLLAVSIAVVGAFTPHLALVSGLVVTFVVLSFAVQSETKTEFVRRLGPALLVAFGGVLVLTAYWVVPILLGRGLEGAKVASVTSLELISFAAVPDPRLGLIPNLLGLYGFWAEDTARFTSLKAYVLDWPAILAGVLAVGVIGYIAARRRGDRQLGAWVNGLVIVAVIAFILEMGVSDPATAGITRWLDGHLSFYRGMRDAAKWAAVLGLVYSQLFGLGAAAVHEWIKGLRLKPDALEWATAAASAILLALPLYYGNGLLFGFHGGIRPSQYPAGWYAADRALLADPHSGRTLFLPWHLYLSFPFIQNQNEVVACPAPGFFSVPILSSTDPGVFGGAPPKDPDQVAVAALVSQGGQGKWSQVLTSLGVKYILLARTVDWANYRFLDTQAGLTKVADYGSLILYEDTG